MKTIDRVFVFLLFSIITVGAMMIFSSTPTLGLRLGDPFFYIMRHVFYLILGTLAFGLALRIDLDELRKYSFHFFVIAFILMLLLFVPGIRMKVAGAGFSFRSLPSNLRKS
jgi:cell division protein FtsW